MANEKMVNSRQQQKHDVEANWLTAGNKGFIPKAGEVIVYDPDTFYSYPRLKVGDGVHNVNALDFLDVAIWEQINTMNQIIAMDDGSGNITLGATSLASVVEEEF